MQSPRQGRSPRERATMGAGVSWLPGSAHSGALQGADVADAFPLISRRHAIGKPIHRALAAVDRVQDCLRGGSHQAWIIERCRCWKSALHDNAVTGAGESVAGRAINVIALTATREQ